MPIRKIKIDSVWKKALMALAVVVVGYSAWCVARWTIASSAVQRTDDAALAIYLTQLAPDDPRTHYAAAVLLDRNFDIEDVAQALTEFERATALSPENYIHWLDLGRARERSGDTEGAEGALRHALALAPHYSRVQWALGNALLRQGRIEEAFELISKAVATDPTFANPAAATAWQFFGGDVKAIRQAGGSSNAFSAALAALLSREGRFDEAVEIWDKLPDDQKRSQLKETGNALVGKLLEANRFRYAIRIAHSVNNGGAEVGSIYNGGFEQPVKPDSAGPFEWQITPGLQPQIVLGTGQKHGGNNSLLFLFNSTDLKEARTVSQTIGIEPGRAYQLEFFYRADLKTSATLNWEVIDGRVGRQIALSAPLAVQTDWTPVVVKFRADPAIDGVTIRFTRSACPAVCPVTGNLWFDDFSLRAAG